MNRKLIFLQISAVTGGMLSALAWYPFFSGFVLLFSFIPLFLLAAEEINENGRFGDRIMFLRLFPGFAVFNIVSLFWIRIVGFPLLIATLTVNSFLMTFTFWLAWIIKRKAGVIMGNVSYIVLWLSMEYLTNNISFLSPWLNLGNGFAGDTSIVQWYEYTGVAGGSLWILISNMTGASLLQKYRQTGTWKPLLKIIAIITLIILAPMLLSYSTGKRAGGPAGPSEEVLIVQPCIDPYLEKFDQTVGEQVQKVLRLAEEKATGNTRWIIAPETTIHEPVKLDSIDDNPYIQSIIRFLSDHPSANFIVGAVTTSNNPEKQIHNSSVLISESGTLDVTHKSKLVPGVESSFSGLISFLEVLFPDLGGISGGYTGQVTQTNLISSITGTSAAPVICFESAFGGYVAGFVRQGAGFINIITNDGWLKGTLGFHQHLGFSKLRAIENRRPVVRASNTGISAIIDIRGNITDSIAWWEEGTAVASITPEMRLTFYTRYGDFLMRTASVISIFILIIHFVALPIRKRVKQ
jgi:apolipoprotein N-acyltransferase